MQIASRAKRPVIQAARKIQLNHQIKFNNSQQQIYQPSASGFRVRPTGKRSPFQNADPVDIPAVAEPTFRSMVKMLFTNSDTPSQNQTIY